MARKAKKVDPVEKAVRSYFRDDPRDKRTARTSDDDRRRDKAADVVGKMFKKERDGK